MAPYIYPVMNPGPNYFNLDPISQLPTRVDSPIEVQDRLFGIMEQTSAEGSDEQGNRPGSNQRQSQPQSEPQQQSSDFRFVVANKPEDFKDKEEMRQSRRHVMHDYLNKTRGQEARPSSSKRQRRDPEHATLPGITPDSLASSTIFQVELGYLTPAATVGSSTGSRASTESEDEATATRPRRRRPPSTSPLLYKNLSSKVQRSLAVTQQPLVKPKAYPNDYDSADANLVPYPSGRYGGDLNPFGTWPRFNRTGIDVEQLKYNCSNYFGSHAMSRNWVPTLLQGRHTFLSTICISSAYHDAMYRSYLKHIPESVERLRVREEVIQLINRSLDDPVLQTQDCTIVAILQLLNGEIISCNENALRTHQHGVTQMINARGGLSKLGVQGELALLTAITMYIIAFLREERPEQQYIDYAVARDTSTVLPPKRPENPVNVPESGYSTLRPVLQGNQRLFELLELTRVLTLNLVPPAAGPHLFGDFPPVRHPLLHSRDTQALHDRIMAMPPALALAKRGNIDHTYEAVRLTAILFSTALNRKVPLSRAAALCTEEQPDIPASSGRARREKRSWHVQIRDSLMKTDISHCWGHMVGGLFWISLVAGAAANTGTVANHRDDNEVDTEDEEARRWLAAITVRCSILLSFEYGDAVLETLKRMLEMQRVLHAAHADSTTVAAPRVAIAPVAPTATTRPGITRGIGDFLADFEGR